MKVSRNTSCHCGKPQKYKRCCMQKDQKEQRVSLFDKFSVIKDPRDNRGKRYYLMDLLVMVIYGILNGYDDFDSLAFFLKQREDYFKNLLLIDKTPSHDCLSDVFAAINPKEFMDIFIEWISGVVEKQTGAIIAIDGKAVRSARDKINRGNTPYILSAYLSEIGISIGQTEVDKKSNEITAIPELLNILDIEGCYITIDAMGTQEDIACKIVGLKGHFVLKVKSNQKKLYQNIRSYFERNIGVSAGIAVGSTALEKKHGRKERREYYVSTEIENISDKDKWDKVSSIGTVFGSALEYNTRAFDSFLKYLDEHDINIIIPKAGDSFMLGTALVEVLAPLRDYNDENNNSLVLKMTYGDISFLFKGDAERASEIDMVEAGLDLSATVLKVSHHGSNTSTTYPFLREVMPEIAIISVGVNNQHKHPHDDTLSRLRDADVKVYRTDLQGDIIIRSDGKNLTVETQRNLDIPTNPTDVSNLHTDSTDTYIDEITHTHIGNARTKKFHTLICHTLPEEHNRVHLESRDHAINDGFDPCGNCKP